MMVIQKVSTGVTFPADSYRWTTVDIAGNNGYAIHSVAINRQGAGAVGEVTTAGQANDIILGQVGKSGRVVPLTQQFTNA